MRQCDVTIQKAIGLSLVVHVLLFGSALAFAQFGGSLFPGELRFITISLVGDADTEEREDGSLTKTVEGSLREHVSDAEKHVLLEDAQLAAISEHAALPEPESGGAADAARERSSSFGYSPEEWRVLQAALERAKTYPRFARERGIEGTTLVRFRVLPTGRIERVDIVRSSGAKVLDDASVRTVYRAEPVPYVAGWVEVPLVYRLREAGSR